ncbi:MAG: site-2 protease family protein [Solirubrobacterales bacterium]|nr:site-2 protease family protein [Solirubrobacterales bacterium]
MSFFLAFLGFAALIVLHELGHFAAAKAVGMRVERFSLFFPPLVARIKRGETEYAIGAVPLGGYVKITGMNPAEEIPEEHQHRAYYRQPVWKRVVVIAAGPIVNVVVAFLLFWVFFVAQGPAVAQPEIESVTPNSPAVGVLMPGDRLLAVDGVRGDFERLRDQIGTHRCAGTPTDGCKASSPALLTVERGGREQQLSITPSYDGELKRPLVGFAPTAKTVAEGPIEASGSSVDAMWNVTTLTVTRISQLFYSAEARKEISGIAGTYETSRQVIKTSSFQTVMSIFGLISLSLAIINLFPFLPLDGGHIFWAVAEKLRGKAISFRTMERASVVGFMLVLALFSIGLLNDIDRFQGEGFGIR